MSRKEGNFSALRNIYRKLLLLQLKNKKKTQQRTKTNQKRSNTKQHHGDLRIFHPVKNNLTWLQNLRSYSPAVALVALYSHQPWGSPETTTGKNSLQDYFSKHDSISTMSQKPEKSILTCNTNCYCMSWTSVHPEMLLAVHD